MLVRSGSIGRSCALTKMSSSPVANLFLAGDYCRSLIDMPSVEGAIVTGELAAWRATEGRSRLPREPRTGGLSPDDWTRLRRYLEPWMKLLRERTSLPSAAPTVVQSALGDSRSAIPISPATAMARPE
jgi:hypothetical protein